MKSIHHLPELFIIFLVISVSSKAQEVTKTFKEIKQIIITTSSSDIILAKGSSKDVEVKVTFTYSPKDFEPIFQQAGDVLKLQEKYANNSSNGDSKWTITIPDGINVKTNSGSGNVEAADLKVSIKSNSGSGSYSWRNLSGESSISTGSGEIHLDSYSGQANISAGSGAIYVNNCQGDVNAGTGSGTISINGFKGVIKAGSGSGEVNAEKFTLTGKSSFGTGSGSVLVKLSEPIAFPISIGSGSGKAVLDCNGLKLAGHITMSASKEYGKIMAPFNFDKTEEIDEKGNDRIMIQKTVQLGNATTEIKITTGSGTAEIKD